MRFQFGVQTLDIVTAKKSIKKIRMNKNVQNLFIYNFMYTTMVLYLIGLRNIDNKKQRLFHKFFFKKKKIF